MNKIEDYTKGFIVGDALGVPFEFRTKQEMKNFPCNRMIGYGTHNQPPGTWSDDTSMLLATMDAIKDSKDIDYDKIMDNFTKWIRYGKYASSGVVFDIGFTCRKAITNYNNGDDIFECGCKYESDNGNGSLMRIAPITFFLRAKFGKNFFENEESFEIIKNTSSLTHAHERSIIACTIYVAIMNEILNSKNKSKKTIIKNAYEIVFEYYKLSNEIEYFGFLEDLNSLSRKKSKDINGSGYVVDTLKSVVWTFLNSETTFEAICTIINLGDDTDTTGALVGGIFNIYKEDEEIDRIFELIIDKEKALKIIDTF